MYSNNNRQPNNHRKTIENYASQSLLYEMIEQQIRNVKYKNKQLPQNVKELPEFHFLSKLLKQSNLSHKYQQLQPFISPNDLMKAYNRKYAKYRFVAVEVYYYYEPKLNNKTLQDYSDPQDFFYEVKNLSKQSNLIQIQKRIQTLMSAYLNKNKQFLHDTMFFQTAYVVPQGYYPLISMRIKYQYTSGGQTKSGFQHLLLRFDQHRRLDNLSKYITEATRQLKLKKNIQIKKLQRANKVKPEQILKKQQLKTVYSIRNVSFGWIQVEQSEFQKKQHFQSHFDIITLQNNIRYAENLKNPDFRTKTYLFFKKGEYQIPKIQILSFLFEQLVFKCVIKLSDIKKVSFFNSKDVRQIYLHVNTNPQFYFHLLDKNAAYNLYNLSPWQRVQNFPIDFQNILGKSIFMRNLLSENSVICIDFRTGKKQFDRVVRYFSAQQIINSQFMYQKPFDQFGDISENLVFKKEKIFNEILKQAKDQLKIKVHQIKFSLLSLKSLEKSKVTYDDLIEFLKQIEKGNIQEIQKHNKSLKMLCFKPHQLLSKPFKEVYPKFLKKQEIFEKLGQKFPNIEIYQLMKLQDAFEMDSISQVSDIGSISQISEVQTEFLNNFFTIIERTRLVLIPRIRLTPNGIVYNGWSMEVASKILKNFRDYEHQFLKCQICDDQGKKIHNSSYILQKYTRKLMDKIKVIDQQYIPLGWSQSQLKQGALWYTLQSKEIKTINRDEILKFMGDFDDKKLNNPALKAARIGQNFGSSWSFDASEINFSEQQDIIIPNSKDKNFSDGIGCISEYNMMKFKQGLNLESLAAVQVRYKGVKGVLSLNKQLPDNTGILRKSMIKYEATHPDSVKYFDIIDYSKYKVGYLNRQIIILLIANKVRESQIISLQTQYTQRLQKDIFEILFENISFDNEEQTLFQNEVDKKFESITEVFKMTLSKTYQDKKNQINNIIFDQNFFKALKVQAKRKLLNKLRQKCRIRVDKSVRLFGILDEFAVLNQYEVYCSIIKPSEKQKTNISGKCLLTKNPCMHPADLRVVNCVSDQQIQKRLKQKGKNPYLFEDLVNVIIFPQKGKTPLTMEISQSDLDGDQFFLTWEQRIVPYKNLDPFVIAQQVPFIERNWSGSGYKQMLDFYVEFQNFHKLGRLANSHLIQADLKGAFCQQCIELCKIHSIAVQYPKRGYDFQIKDDLFYHMYPHYMEKQHPKKSYRSTSIIGTLYNAVLRKSDLKGAQYLTILKDKKQIFWKLIQIYVNMNEMKAIKQKSVKKIIISKIIEKYEQMQEQIQIADDQINQKQQIQEPVSLSNVKKQYQIENKQLYKKKSLPFSKQNLDRLINFIARSQKSLKYDMNQPFSLAQILTTFNYLSIFYNELKQLSQLLQNEHESIYTIYFELQTSSKNKNNLYLLQRINQLRMKWLNFFGQQLVNEGCFLNVAQFENFYFNKLIEKKPQNQDKNSKFQKLKELAQRKNQIKKIMNEMEGYEPNNAEFILDQIQNLKITKKSLQYDKYMYSSLKDINPLIYRKLVLFYIVSNYFDEIVLNYDISNFIQNDGNFKYDQDGIKIRSFLQNGQLPKALKQYKENQIYFLGFCWFCMPKLMVIWWRDIFREEEAKIIEKNQQKPQIQKSQISSNLNNFIKVDNPVDKPVVSQKPFQKKSNVIQKENHLDLIDQNKCNIF